jgi:hypothetical protein
MKKAIAVAAMATLTVIAGITGASSLIMLLYSSLQQEQPLFRHLRRQ